MPKKYPHEKLNPNTKEKEMEMVEDVELNDLLLLLMYRQMKLEDRVEALERRNCDDDSGKDSD